jgi:hypothetical protein
MGKKQMLTDEQCQTVIEWLELQEWKGISKADVRLFDALIQAASSDENALDSGGRLAIALKDYEYPAWSKPEWCLGCGKHATKCTCSPASGGTDE